MAEVTVPLLDRRPPDEETVDTGEPVTGTGWIRVADVTLHLVGLRMLGYWPLVVNYPDIERVLEVDPAGIDQQHIVEVFPNSRTRWLFVAIRAQSDVQKVGVFERPTVDVRVRRQSDGFVLDTGFTWNAAHLSSGVLEIDLPDSRFAGGEAISQWPVYWVSAGERPGDNNRPRPLSIGAEQRTLLEVVLDAKHTRVLHVDVWELAEMNPAQEFTP